VEQHESDAHVSCIITIVAALGSLEIGAIKGDKAYILTYEAGMNEYDKYLPIIQEMINSFQITK
jgi:hypothetical protein